MNRNGHGPTWDDIFPMDEEEYPENVAERGVPQDTWYTYISSTFLSAFINYVEPFAVMMIQRYCNWPDSPIAGLEDEETIDTEALQAEFRGENEPGGSKFKYHCRVGRDVPDDLFVLAESENSWWFFWWDRDCSDCCIARASKSNYTREQVKAAFLVDAKERSDTGRTLELAVPKGWWSA